MTPSDLLKLIENVDPQDTGAMDEIDYLTWCFVEEMEPVSPASDYGFIGLKYTRSRDALKAIRPEGWSIDACGISFYSGGYFCNMWRHSDKFMVESEPFPDPRRVGTEELAELHAIIQAIEHERSGA